MKYWYERINVEPSSCNTVKEFLDEKNFNWEITRLTAYRQLGSEYFPITKYAFSARSDDYTILGIVKPKYKLLNNKDCFEIADNFKKKYNDSKFISCGDILNRKRSYLTMKLKSEIIENDMFDFYLTIVNSFDGRGAVNCTLTPIRRNDNSVFQLFNKDIKRTWTMSRLDIKKSFDEICTEIENYIIFMKNICNYMNRRKIDFNHVMNPLYDIDWLKRKCINRHLAESKGHIKDIFVKNKGSTLYDLYFAISSYYCNIRGIRQGKLGDDKRFNFAMIGYFYELHDLSERMLQNTLDEDIKNSVS